MLDMARKAVGKVRDLPREAYDADANLRLALIHLVQVIGEAAREASREFTVTHPEVPWENIIGMRHKVVHGLPRRGRGDRLAGGYRGSAEARRVTGAARPAHAVN
jgi:uncharacterized protein with HEPN domain